MLPCAIFISESPRDALIESGAVFIIGNVLAISFHSGRREREHRVQLEIAQQEQQRFTEELKIMQQNLPFYLQQATLAQEEKRKRICIPCSPLFTSIPRRYTFVSGLSENTGRSAVSVEYRYVLRGV